MPVGLYLMNRFGAIKSLNSPQISPCAKSYATFLRVISGAPEAYTMFILSLNVHWQVKSYVQAYAWLSITSSEPTFFRYMLLMVFKYPFLTGILQADALCFPSGF